MHASVEARQWGSTCSYTMHTCMRAMLCLHNHMAPCHHALHALQYATWSHNGRIGGVSFAAVKRLLKELDLLEGIPPGLTDEFVRQHMLRADQDKDGLLSIQEFMGGLWRAMCMGVYGS